MFKYLVAFSIYTLAMVGILLISYIVYKKASGGSVKKEGGMKIEDALRLSQRKMLYIVNVRGERFLIASDAERTTFLAKLQGKQGVQTEQINMAIENKPKQDLNKNLYNIISNDVQTQEDNDRKQIEEYIKELEALDIIDKSIEEDDYSNAVDISRRNTNTVLKNILKELRESKRGRA